MTTAAGDDAVEQAFEAWLAGRPVPSAEHRLGVFADAVRASATAPGRPSAALADLLATGLLTDQSSPSAATARSARRTPGRGRRRRLRMLGPALFAKFLSAGLAAKAATVAGVVVVGFGTAGFTGALPTHVQHSFATLVDSSTPFHAPDPAVAGTGTATRFADENDGTADENEGTADENDGTTDENEGTTDEGATDENGGTPGESGGTTGEQSPTTGDSGTAGAGTQDPSRPDTFGQQVSTMAHQNKQDGKPGVDGRTVSSLAHAKHSRSATDGDQQDGAAEDGTGDENSDAGTTADDRSGDRTGGHGSSGERGESAAHGRGHR
jgi:hypothetical protein